MALFCMLAQSNQKQIYFLVSAWEGEGATIGEELGEGKGGGLGEGAVANHREEKQPARSCVREKN